MSSTWPNPTYVGWVRLDLCDGLGWVEFFFTHHGGLGQKIRSTRPMHTPISNIGGVTPFQMCELALLQAY